MNKKQLIVAWVMGISIILSIVFPIQKITDYEFGSTFKDYRFEQIVVILIIGGLLIYTLRKKK
mgnify:CR=1 FL=1